MSKSRFPIQWFKHLNEKKEQEEFEKLVRNSTQILNRLDQMLNEQLDTLQKERLSKDGFKDPNWALLQAYNLGRIKEIVEIRKLFDFLHGESE